MAKKKLDFTGVDSDVKRGGGGGKHIPEGDYVVKILEGEYFKPEPGSGKSPGYKWLCQVVKGPHKGTKLRGFTSLKPEALWSLRNLIHAATGKNVAGKSVNFDPDSLEGKIVGAEVQDNEYKKKGSETTKLTSQINTFFPKDEVSDPDEEDEDDDDADEEEEETEEEDEEDLEDVEVEDI